MSLAKATLLGFGFFLAVGPALAEGCTVTLADDIQPILDASCVACHQDASPGEGLSLQKKSTFANTVNVASTQVPEMMRIVPGDAAASYLFRKLQGTHEEVGGAGDMMPYGGELLAEELAKVEAWINACGAAE